MSHHDDKYHEEDSGNNHKFINDHDHDDYLSYHEE